MCHVHTSSEFCRKTRKRMPMYILSYEDTLFIQEPARKHNMTQCQDHEPIDISQTSLYLKKALKSKHKTLNKIFFFASPVQDILLSSVSWERKNANIMNHRRKKILTQLHVQNKYGGSKKFNWKICMYMTLQHVTSKSSILLKINQLWPSRTQIQQIWLTTDENHENPLASHVFSASWLPTTCRVRNCWGKKVSLPI